jgi:hypothetical protein
MGEAAWSGTGVRVLSVNASSKSLPAMPEPSGSGATTKPRRLRQTGDRASRAFSWPHSRRPLLTDRATSWANVTAKRAGSRPFRASRQYHNQARATASAMWSSLVSGQRTWRR